MSVIDGGGHVVIESRLGAAAKPFLAVFQTALGEWRVERKDPFVPPGPKRQGLRDRAEGRLEVFDPSGSLVATLHAGELALTHGETLVWVPPDAYSTSCRAGECDWG